MFSVVLSFCRSMSPELGTHDNCRKLPIKLFYLLLIKTFYWRKNVLITWRCKHSLLIPYRKTISYQLTQALSSKFIKKNLKIKEIISFKLGQKYISGHYYFSTNFIKKSFGNFFEVRQKALIWHPFLNDPSSWLALFNKQLKTGPISWTPVQFMDQNNEGLKRQIWHLIVAFCYNQSIFSKFWNMVGEIFKREKTASDILIFIYE